MRKSKNFDSYIVKPTITAKMMGKTIKGHGSVKITKSNKSIDLIFEVARREEDWKSKFVERLRVYKEFLEMFVPFDCGFQTRPQFIVVCEDDRHMVEVFKEILTNNLIAANTKIYFTTDLKQNSETLEKSLVEFVQDETTGKYAAKSADFKLLG